MSDAPPGPVPKAIGSLVKKQADVTRQGTQKLKFVPTLPQRRKKEEANAEPAPSASTSTDRDHGIGRGRGEPRGRGRGRGRGAPPVVEMTASGPFAMGPTLAGSSIRRSTPRSNFAPSAAVSRISTSVGNSLDLGNTGGNVKSGTAKTDEEYYSDPDEGVEIVDMENVHQMDWMAPDSIRKEPQKLQKKVKKQEQSEHSMGLGQTLDLDESEDDELEDIVEDFGSQTDMKTDDDTREEKLFLFQFPTPFPTFSSKMTNISSSDQIPEVGRKKVSFAEDTKPDTVSSSSSASVAPSEPKKPEPISGVIGQLEIYRSGTVKIRLANDILLNLNAATQPSFLQQAVNLDVLGKQFIVLGEVNKQFVVSPNVEALLSAMGDDDNAPVLMGGGDTLIKMDS
ncbi:hypothetical protein BYT27DRAFT_7199114 [Phlegmacium glaucopus]|nr:hypothetical protein BYT27DRAFT_7199114 [Phlegmacium glaucopus]